MQGKGLKTTIDKTKIRKTLISNGWKITDKKGKLLIAEKDGKKYTAISYPALHDKIDASIMEAKELEKGFYSVPPIWER